MTTPSESSLHTTPERTGLNRDADDLIARFLDAWNAHQTLRGSDATVLARLASRRRLDDLRLSTRVELERLGVSLSNPGLAA